MIPTNCKIYQMITYGPTDGRWFINSKEAEMYTSHFHTTVDKSRYLKSHSCFVIFKINNLIYFILFVYSSVTRVIRYWNMISSLKIQGYYQWTAPEKQYKWFLFVILIIRDHIYILLKSLKCDVFMSFKLSNIFS